MLWTGSPTLTQQHDTPTLSRKRGALVQPPEEEKTAFRSMEKQILVLARKD